MSAAVLFVDESDKVLLLKPTYRDDWNLAGGVIEESESPLDGAIRETKEELGISVAKQDLTLSAVDYRPAKDGFVDKLYFYFFGGVLTSDQIDSIVLQEEEIEEMRFVTLDEAKGLLSKWTYRQVALSLKSRGEKGIYLESGCLLSEVQA